MLRANSGTRETVDGLKIQGALGHDDHPAFFAVVISVFVFAKSELVLDVDVAFSESHLDFRREEVEVGEQFGVDAVGRDEEVLGGGLAEGVDDALLSGLERGHGMKHND